MSFFFKKNLKHDYKLLFYIILQLSYQWLPNSYQLRVPGIKRKDRAPPASWGRRWQAVFRRGKRCRNSRRHTDTDTVVSTYRNVMIWRWVIPLWRGNTLALLVQHVSETRGSLLANPRYDFNAGSLCVSSYCRTSSSQDLKLVWCQTDSRLMTQAPPLSGLLFPL